MHLNELTIKKAQIGLRKKEFSAVELTRACLTEAESRNPELKAYLEIFASDSLAEAKKADEILAGHSPWPELLGIPLAVKDNILFKGKKTTACSRILENYEASYDASVVKRMKNHGAVILGKTNLDEFAMGSSTENSAFGPTKNPHDLERVPGGSSGGSAAAVAADLCLGALGSDTGGSIRQPASFCGIVGLKPTYGAVSRHGLIAMASSLDQIGPMAKGVEDAEIIFSAICGQDDFDSTSSPWLEPRLSEDEILELKDFKFGIPKEYLAQGLDAQIKSVVEAAIKKIELAGAKIQEISLPYSKYSLACYYIIVPAEISANLARFDGIRYGLREDADNLFEIYTSSRAKNLGPEVKRRIMLGTYVLSAGYYDAYYLKAQKVRRLVKNDFKMSFEEVDFILGPTTPNPAWKFGEKTEDPLQMYLEDIYTVAVNLAGVPALSLPAGKIEVKTSQMPVGLQVIGPWFKDFKLLRAAQEIEKILNFS